jgi:hypothetical protein
VLYNQYLKGKFEKNEQIQKQFLLKKKTPQCETSTDKSDFQAKAFQQDESIIRKFASPILV